MPSLKKIRDWASGARVSGLPKNTSFKGKENELKYDINIGGNDAKLEIDGKTVLLSKMGEEDSSILDEIVFGDYPDDLKDVALYLMEENEK